MANHDRYGYTNGPNTNLVLNGDGVDEENSIAITDPTLSPPWKAYLSLRYMQVFYHNYQEIHSTWDRREVEYWMRTHQPSLSFLHRVDESNDVSNSDPMEAEDEEEIRNIRKEKKEGFEHCSDYRFNSLKSSNFTLAVDFVAVFDTCSLIHMADVLDITIRSKSMAVVPYTVMKESDIINKRHNRTSQKAGRIHRTFDKFSEQAHPLFVLESGKEALEPMTEIKCDINDDIILKCALRIFKCAWINSMMEGNAATVVFVTEDLNLRQKARSYQLESMGVRAFVDQLICRRESRGDDVKKEEERNRMKEEFERNEKEMRREEEERRRREEDRMRKEEEKRRREEERKRKEEEDRMRKEEEKRRREEERKRKEEEDRMRKEEEKRRKEEERTRKVEEDRMRKEEEKKRKEEEMMKKMEEQRTRKIEEKRRKEEERIKKQEDDKMRKMKDKEWRRKADEHRRWEEHQKRIEEEKRRMREEEEMRRMMDERWNVFNEEKKRMKEKRRKEDEIMREERGRREEEMRIREMERMKEEERVKMRNSEVEKKLEQPDIICLDGVVWNGGDEWNKGRKREEKKEKKKEVEVVELSDNEEDMEMEWDWNDHMDKLNRGDNRPVIPDRIWDEYTPPGEIFYRLLEETPWHLYSTLCDPSLELSVRDNAFENLKVVKKRIESFDKEKNEDNLFALYVNLHPLHQSYVVRSSSPPKMISKDSLINYLSSNPEKVLSSISQSLQFIGKFQRPVI